MKDVGEMLPESKPTRNTIPQIDDCTLRNLPPGHEKLQGDDKPCKSNLFHYFRRGYGESAFFRGGNVVPDTNRVVRSDSAKLSRSIKTKTDQSKHKGGRGGWDPFNTYKVRHASIATVIKSKEDKQCFYKEYNEPSLFVHGVTYYVEDDSADSASEGEALVVGDEIKRVRLRYPIPSLEDFYYDSENLLLRPRGANMGVGTGYDSSFRMPAYNNKVNNPHAGALYPDGPEGCGIWLPNIRQGIQTENGFTKPSSAYVYDRWMGQIEQMVMMAGTKTDAFGRELRKIGADGRYHDNENLPCDETPVSFIASLDTLADALGGLAEWTHYFVEAIVEVTVRYSYYSPRRKEKESTCPFGPFYKNSGDISICGNLDSYKGRWNMMENLTSAVWDMVKESAFGRELNTKAKRDDDVDVKQRKKYEAESLCTPLFKYESIGYRSVNKSETPQDAEVRVKEFFKEILKYVKLRNPRNDDGVGWQEEEERYMIQRHEWLTNIADGLSRNDAAYETLFSSKPLKRYSRRTNTVNAGKNAEYACLTAGPPPNAMCVRMHAAIRYASEALMACVSREFLTSTWTFPEGHDKGIHLFKPKDNEHEIGDGQTKTQSVSDWTEELKTKGGSFEPLMPELHFTYQQARCFAWTFPDASDFYIGDKKEVRQLSDAKDMGGNKKWKPFFGAGKQSIPLSGDGASEYKYIYELSTGLNEQQMTNMGNFEPGQHANIKSFTNRGMYCKPVETQFKIDENLEELWKNVEPGIAPTDYDPNNTLPRMKLTDIDGSMSDLVSSLFCSHPALEVDAPKMPAPCLWWKRGDDKKGSTINDAMGWLRDFYDVDNSQVAAADSGGGGGVMVDLQKEVLAQSTRLEQYENDDLVCPRFVFETPNPVDASNLQRYKFDFPKMVTEWTTSKNEQPELFSGVCPPPPRRPVFYESLYNMSLLSWLRCEMGVKMQMPDYTKYKLNPATAMVSIPSYVCVGKANKTGKFNNDDKTGVSSFPDLALSAVLNSNSIFLILIRQWMVRSGITRDCCVPSGDPEDDTSAVYAPFDRYHTAYPESWIGTSLNGEYGEDMKVENPTSVILDVVKGYELQFKQLVYCRASVHAYPETYNKEPVILNMATKKVSARESARPRKATKQLEANLQIL